MNCTSIQSCSFNPLIQGKRQALKSEKNGVSSINVLFFPRGPFAVFWAIVSVYVASLQGKVVWTFSHVLQKIFKTIQPSFAYLNTTATICSKMAIFGIATSALHATPCSVFLGVSAAMSKINISRFFSMDAPATNCHPTHKSIPANLMCIATITLAQPNSLRIPSKSCIFDNDQATKSFSREVFCCHE